MFNKNSKLLTIVLIITAVMAIAIISGCTDQNKQENITQLTFGYQPSTHQAAYTTAKEKGWWDENLSSLGVIKVDDKLFPNGAPEMQAMLANEIQVAYVGAAPFISALSQGLDGKIIAAVQIDGSGLVVRNDLDYTGPQSLKGLKVATFPPGTIQDTLMRNWFQQNGMDPDKDVTILGMTGPNAATALAAGQVDAVFLPEPTPTQLESAYQGKIVAKSGEILPNHACCVVVASGNLIRNEPALVRKIVETHIKATEYNNANPSEAAEIYAKDEGLNSSAVIQKSVKEWDGKWIADPHQIINSTVEYAKIQYDLGYIKKPLNETDIFDVSFYDSIEK